MKVLQQKFELGNHNKSTFKLFGTKIIDTDNKYL